MKKILITVIALLIVVSLCACGEKPVNTQALDNVCEYVDSIIPTEGFTSEADYEKLTVKWTAPEGTSAELSDKLELDGKTVTLGKTTVAELKEMGFKPDEKTPEKVESGKNAEIAVTLNDQHCSVFTEVNDTDKAVLTDDLVINGFYVTSDAFSPFSYNGLNEKTTLEEVFKQEGMPASSINAATRGSSSLIYIIYNKKVSDGQTPATLTIGAEFNGSTSRLFSFQYISE